jgi:hypothetical protein
LFFSNLSADLGLVAWGNEDLFRELLVLFVLIRKLNQKVLNFLFSVEQREPLGLIRVHIFFVEQIIPIFGNFEDIFLHALVQSLLISDFGLAIIACIRIEHSISIRVVMLHSP